MKTETLLTSWSTVATLAALENLGVARSAFARHKNQLSPGKRHSLHFELLMKFIARRSRGGNYIIVRYRDQGNYHL